MIRPTDSTHPNDPVDTPNTVQKPMWTDPLKGVERMPWPRKPLGGKGPKGKSNSGFARTGIHFGVKKKRG